MKLTWFGHSNFRIEASGATILIDPFFEGNPRAPIKHTDIKHADVVLVTHDHGDHTGQAVQIARRTKATLVSVFDTANSLVEQGLPGGQSAGMNIGGTVELSGVKIKMVQAVHSSATGTCAGYILTFPDGFCLYHSGDTGLFASMELFGRFHDITLALLPIDGRFNMDAKQAAYACKLLGCKMVAPMHWGTFPVLAQSTDSFAEFLAEIAPDTRLLQLAIGAPLEVGRD